MKKKCDYCKQKIKSVLPIPCKCKKYFCNKHKFSEEHKCTYDYLTENREKLKKDNPKVSNNRINLIF